MFASEEPKVVKTEEELRKLVKQGYNIQNFGYGWFASWQQPYKTGISRPIDEGLILRLEKEKKVKMELHTISASMHFL